MAVEAFKDPRTGKISKFVKGVVEGIYFNELKSPKTYTANGRQWTPTHSITIVVDGVRISLGLTEKSAVNVKDENDQWVELARGMEISVDVDEGEYNGKPQYGSRSSNITILSTEGAIQESSNQKGSSPQFSSKRGEGVSVGHAINVAMNVLRDLTDPSAIVENAKGAHTLTTRLKEEYASENTDMSEYDVGARVGQAVLSASHYVESVADIEALARQTLTYIVPQVEEFVRNGGDVESKETPKKVTKKAPAKTVEDLEDDIPF